MTRWCRANNAHRVKPDSATPWSTLNASTTSPPSLKSVDAVEKACGIARSTNRKTLKKSNSKNSDLQKIKKNSTLKGNRTNKKIIPSLAIDQSFKELEKQKNSESKMRSNSSNEVNNNKNQNDHHPHLNKRDRKRVHHLNSILSDGKVNRHEKWKIIRKEKSKMVRAENRRAKSCFKCRRPGHVLADCPVKDEGTEICFKCGSTEHKSKECKRRKTLGENEYPFATCFVCNQQGHLSSSCSSNASGIYPYGGSCHCCGSLNHLQKNCPKLMDKTREDDSYAVARFDANGNVEAETTENLHRKGAVQYKKPKFVEFK